MARLAVWVEDHPDIFPVNYTVDHGTLVFRSGEGTKLSAALSGVPVALETDGVDADTGTAWSVVAKGPAGAVERPNDVLDSAGLLLFPWEAGHKDHFVRITPETLTGRRFTVTSPFTWWTPLEDVAQASEE